MKTIKTQAYAVELINAVEDIISHPSVIRAAAGKHHVPGKLLLADMVKHAEEIIAQMEHDEAQDLGHDGDLSVEPVPRREPNQESLYGLGMKDGDQDNPFRIDDDPTSPKDEPPFEPFDVFYEEINQADRELTCIAVVGNKSLCEYTMPAGRSFLRMFGGRRLNIAYGKLNAKWIETIVNSWDEYKHMASDEMTRTIRDRVGPDPEGRW